jgi:hypothetical protein
MKPEELFRYHPQEFRHSRSYFKRMFQRYKSLGVDEKGLSDAALIALGNEFIGIWNEELDSIPVAERPFPTERVNRHVSLFCHVARWAFCGRNIFHFSAALTGLLGLSDVNDVRWEHVFLPYRSFYIWFGPRRSWQIGESDSFVDGVYVTENNFAGERIVELLVTTRPEKEACSSFVFQTDDYYYFPFRIRSDSETVGESLAETLKTDTSFDRTWTPPAVPEQLAAEMREFGIDLRQLAPGNTAHELNTSRNYKELPIFREVLPLAINALCYLGSSKREIVARMIEPAAQKKLSQARTQSERREVTDRLKRQGFTEIGFCGESLDREYPNFSTGRELSAHWRRGHWRNQAHGTGLSNRKPLWIRPTLVRKDKADGNVPGHVYNVSA